ncbi:hypothetical protein [Pseudomarimonas salicorniae]|uniref:Transmembrane protein n=1 Tax=Pseudomarimonas salicorniae TaxID=2933270 RepID=A0ABT0GIK8_9GAMM|nr:hypothetical protein [Lysobacter sp. CAU 1642]MCK7594378.1 hypothetical protein [Lysobacter sp. CAU 1642]
MQFEFLIPIVLFIAIAASIKFVMEYRFRRRLAETHASEDLVRAMLVADEQGRRTGALKWGIVLTLVGFAFGLIDLLGLGPDDPATYGFLIGSAGLGMLGFHFYSRQSG